MGPLLFILYVNDLSEATANLTMTLYANDTALLQLSQSDLSQLVLGMKQTIDWLDKNKITLNFDKTFFIQFSKKGGNKSNQISFERNHIENKKLVRYLGILIDEKLYYKDQIQYLIHKMNVFCASFYKLRTVLNKNQLIFAYKTYVQPILQYGVLIYGTAAKGDIKKLNNKIKHLVRMLYGKPKFESIENFRIATKIYNIEELHLFELLKLVNKKRS